MREHGLLSSKWGPVFSKHFRCCVLVLIWFSLLKTQQMKPPEKKAGGRAAPTFSPLGGLLDPAHSPTSSEQQKHKSLWDMGRYRFYVPAECASGKGMKSLPRNFSIYVQLQSNHLLFIAWVKPFISWMLHIWVPTYHRQNRHFVLAAALCTLRSALCSLRFSPIFSLLA